MARPKFDGVVEAVHYKADGQVEWVRAYLRRGATYSDRILLDRQTLLEHLKSGKRIVAGQRVPLMASTFEVSKPLRFIPQNGRDILVVDDIQANQDCLEGVPVI
jgi:hypothetical protein